MVEKIGEGVKKRVLIVGSGGREHAIAWKLSRGKTPIELYCAPGNAGISALAECVDIPSDDICRMVGFSLEKQIDFVVVGPEVPLAMGLVDALYEAGIPAFGPNRQCSQLEASKSFTKKFLMKHGIPTAGYREYTDLESLKEDVGIFGYPMVIKADGLAAGKGVVIAEKEEDAIQTMEAMMGDRIFGNSGDRVVVEEYLEGIEASVLCFVDENTMIPMESAQDYKRIYDGDRGPNTGGMGAYSPSLIFDTELKGRIQREILAPTLKGFQQDGLRFKGILFVGLMIQDGVPKVIEFNNRFGDPETQVVLPRLESDLLDIFVAVTENRLADMEIKWSNKKAVCVVMAANGYPEQIEKGKQIQGLDSVDPDVLVFHGGTKKEKIQGEIQVVTNGGRVLGVTALGETHEEAREKAYHSLSKITFSGAQYRRDIGILRQ